MELHAINWVAAVLHGHDLGVLGAVGAPGGDDEIFGQGGRLYDERVVAHAGERARYTSNSSSFSWITWHVLPCISRSARTTRPPNASPIAWWPRQTPRIGIFPARACTRGTRMPASRGVHGPGESTAARGFRARTSATVSASLRYTTGSWPNSPNSWTRL